MYVSRITHWVQIGDSFCELVKGDSDVSGFDHVVVIAISKSAKACFGMAVIVSEILRSPLDPEGQSTEFGAVRLLEDIVLWVDVQVSHKLLYGVCSTRFELSKTVVFKNIPASWGDVQGFIAI